MSYNKSDLQLVPILRDEIVCRFVAFGGLEQAIKNITNFGSSHIYFKHYKHFLWQLSIYLLILREILQQKIIFTRSITERQTGKTVGTCPVSVLFKSEFTFYENF